MIYNAIKKVCVEKHVSICKLEKDLGFSVGSICKWNENEPSVRKVEKVANYLKVKIEKLLE